MSFETHFEVLSTLLGEIRFACEMYEEDSRDQNNISGLFTSTRLNHRIS